MTGTALQQVGFGGGCHWCTEGVFRSIRGIEKVEQGWLNSVSPYDTMSEAIIVHYLESVISLALLIEIHLNTHSCTSNHSMRQKYRSAIYTFSTQQVEQAQQSIVRLQKEFSEEILTLVLPVGQFQLNHQNYLDYYYSNPDKPFCQTQIKPKLRRILQTHGNLMTEKAKTLI